LSAQLMAFIGYALLFDDGDDAPADRQDESSGE
jgi:hypothetical protein